jgi:hypothetical protein
MMRRLILFIAGIAALIAVLAYLRDPPWLIRVDSGFRGWETGSDGSRYRWTSGHASFFVPSTATAVVVPAKTTFGPGDAPVHLTISIDDRIVDRDLLTDERWHARTVRLPQPESRRVRRIDIRVDRVRAGNRGAQIGDITLLR